MLVKVHTESVDNSKYQMDVHMLPIINSFLENEKFLWLEKFGVSVTYEKSGHDTVHFFADFPDLETRQLFEEEFEAELVS